jgi:hypothetical protein
MLKQYSLLDDHGIEGIRYYRLKQVDYNGDFKYSNVVHFSDNKVSVFYSENRINIDLGTYDGKAYLVNVYEVNGELVYRAWLNSDQIIDWKNKGLYIVEIPGMEFRKKIVCH